MGKHYIVLTLLTLTLFSSSFNVTNLSTVHSPNGVQPYCEDPQG